jgi:hypothetical protein
MQPGRANSAVLFVNLSTAWPCAADFHVRLQIRNTNVVTHLSRTVLVILFLLTVSCLPFDPYKKFEDQLQSEIGQSIDDVPSYSGHVRSELAFKTPLPNGNIEYHYVFENIRGLCRYVFEVDPTTCKIVGWRYDGEDKDKACFDSP